MYVWYSTVVTLHLVSSSSPPSLLSSLQTGSIRLKLHVGFRVMYMASQGTLLVAGLSNGFVHAIDLQVHGAQRMEIFCPTLYSIYMYRSALIELHY